ncbi:MAG: hypothetical protein ABEJ68_06070 [Halobacteriaceae archaeon]
MRRAHLLGRLSGLLLSLLFTGTALAHGASLGAREASATDVPTWLVLLTGGAVVGASFLLASFATDRDFVRSLHEWRRPVSLPRAPLAWVGRALGLVALAVVVVGGVLGPTDPQRNVAILLVWVGWWAGLVMGAYLVGDVWRALDPARTVSRALPGGVRPLPSWLGAWPSVVAFLALVFVEVVSPLAERPSLLVAAVAGYVTLAVAGAVAVGRADWFERVDPVARVFRTYGRVAPIQRTEDGLAVSLPGAALVDATLSDGDVAFVVALLWGTTFDGLVATPAWADVVGPVFDAGVPPRALYLVTLVAGFVAFYAAYRAATRAARRTAPTYVTADALARRFAASLLPIAAGYHLAHYLDYFLRLAPSLASAAVHPLSPVPLVLVVPGWLEVVSLFAVLLGHVVAVAVAHAVAFDTFPGRMQAIRSQYPLTVVLVCYTVVSLWIVSQPTVTPPGL